MPIKTFLRLEYHPADRIFNAYLRKISFLIVLTTRNCFYILILLNLALITTKSDVSNGLNCPTPIELSWCSSEMFSNLF